MGRSLLIGKIKSLKNNRHKHRLCGFARTITRRYRLPRFIRQIYLTVLINVADTIDFNYSARNNADRVREIKWLKHAVQEIELTKYGFYETISRH